MHLKCLIVDDEPIAQNILKGYINDTPDLILIDICNNALEASKILDNERIDLLFLDIEMPKITGISFLKTIEVKPFVIFSTAYREFAIESYNLNAIDYLLKPFSFERFLTAVNKVKNRKKELQGSKKYDYFKVDRKNVKIYYDDILYIEGLSNYVMIHTLENQYIIYLRLIDLEKTLPSNNFIRIHRSFIVSALHIKAYGSDYIEIASKQLSIGNTYRDRFFDFINKT